MTKLRNIPIALLLLFSCRSITQAQVISCSAASLSAVATCLTPGQWGEVTGMTNFFNYAGSGVTILSYPPVTNGNNALDFQTKGAWNPQTHELFVYGGAHPDGDGPFYKVFAKYNADTNAWTMLSLSSDTNQPQNTPLHYYQWNTIDTVNQDFYVEDYSISGGGGFGSEFRAMKYHIPTGVWTTLNHNYSNNSTSLTPNTQDAFEYFPDTDKLIWFNTTYRQSGGVQLSNTTQYNNNASRWEFLNGIVLTPPTSGTQGFDLAAGEQYGTAHYDNVHHVMYIGGGSPFSAEGATTHSNQLWTLDKTGTTTALPPAPSGIHGGQGSTLEAVDPITGTYIFWWQEASPSTTIHQSVWKQGDVAWTTTDVSAVAPLITPGSRVSEGGSGDYLFTNEVTAEDSNDGVILVLQNQNYTNGHLYVFKYDQRKSFTDKVALSGNLNGWSFDSPTNIDKNGQALRYNWSSPNSNLDNDPLLMGKTNYPYTGHRDLGEANAQGFNMFATPTPSVNSIPAIDTTVKFEGGGSLTIPMRQYNMEESGQFVDNLDGHLGHPNVAICNNITNCPQGNTLWVQYMVMFTPNMIDDYVFQCSLQLGGTCYNGNDSGIIAHAVNSGGGTTSDKELDCSSCSPGYESGFCIAASNPGDCVGTHIGRRLFLYQGNTGANCVPGIYTIGAVNSYQQVVLDRSPSSVGTQCTRPVILVEEISNTVGGAEGWKLSLEVSNALATAANCECSGEVFHRGNQSFPVALQVYDNKGAGSPGAPQENYIFRPYTWYEVTTELIAGTEDSGTHLTPVEVKWWIDGNLAYDWTGGHVDLTGAENGYGFGQIQIENYTTHRDPFYQGSADGQMWVDNLLTSTTQPPFNSDGGGDVVPCSSPAKVVFTSQPSSATLGSSLGIVVGQIQDFAGVLCTTATNSVTLLPHTGATWSGLHSSSSLTKNASGGIVTWTDLSVTTTPGVGSIDAASAGLTAAISNTLNITATTGTSSRGHVRPQL